MGYNRKNLGLFRNFIVITTWEKKKKKRKENLECLENTRKVCKPRGATKRGWYTPVNR